MKSILAKLSPEEIKELSKAINKQQAKSFGNPLSLRKQEQLMAEVFGVKDWSTLLGSSTEAKPYDPNAKYHKTIVQIEILSEDHFPYEYNIAEISESIHFGDCSGRYFEVSREVLSPKEMADALTAQGSGLELFQGLAEELDEDEEAPALANGHHRLMAFKAQFQENQEYNTRLMYSIISGMLFDEFESLWMNGKEQDVAEKMVALFKRETQLTMEKWNKAIKEKPDTDLGNLIADFSDTEKLFLFGDIKFTLNFCKKKLKEERPQ